MDFQSKNVIANHSKDEDYSLLEFNPAKRKEQEKEEPVEPIKRSSELSDYKSIDMMEINSNCKISEKEKEKEKEREKEKEKDREKKKEREKDREKLDYLSDDNHSLGINTLKS